ncbi:MAG: hypothetical protein J6Y44_03495 [Clostridia bacterium]|nr:hypothetical protein [Clostridia bacterium]
MFRLRYKFRPWVLAVIIIAVVIAAAGIALNIYRFITVSETGDSYEYVSLIIAILVLAVGLTVFSAALISSYYTVTDTELVLNWGFLKNRLPIKTMTRVVLEQTRMQLVIYYNADEFFVINAKTVEYLDLIEALRKKNGKIVFEISSREETPKDENK